MPWVYADTGEEVPTEHLPYLEAAERHAAAPPPAPPQPGFLRSAADAAAETGLGPLYEPRTPLGRRVQGAREAVGTMASGMLAFPAGVATQLASRVPPEGSIAEHVLPPALPGERDLDYARRMRRQVEEALTYRPRTPEGQEALQAVGRVASPEVVRPLVRKVGRQLGPEAEDVAAMALSPLTYVGGLRPLGQALGDVVRAGGQKAAIRTLGASPAAAGRMAELRGPAGMQELGQAVLDIPGAQLRLGPKGTYVPPGGGPLRAAMDPVGKRLSDIASVAGERGGVVNLGGVLDRFDAATQGLARDPFARDRLAKVRDYVVETAKGGATPWSATPEEAWSMRQGLDDVIYNATSDLRRNSPITAEFGRLRGLVDDALGKSVETALGPEAGKAWTQANRMYHNLADVRRLAKAGYRQQAGAEFAPPVGSELRFGAGTGYRMPFLSRFMTRYPVQPRYGGTAVRARLSQFLAGPSPEELLPLGF